MRLWTPPHLSHDPQLVEASLRLDPSGWWVSEARLMEVANAFSLDVTFLRKDLVLRYTANYFKAEMGQAVAEDKPLFGPGFIHQYSSCCGYAVRVGSTPTPPVWCGKCGDEIARYGERANGQRSLLEEAAFLCSLRAENVLEASLWAHDVVGVIGELEAAIAQLDF